MVVLYKKKRKFPMKENRFLVNFMEKFVACAPADRVWKIKIHGEPMQTRGIPDVIFNYYGLFVSIEFKVMRKGQLCITPYQEYTSECILKTNGIHVFVWFDEDTSEIGIGMKRFPKIQQATLWFVDLLEAAIRVAPMQRATDKGTNLL